MRLDVQWGGSTGEGWRIAGVGQTHVVAQFHALSAIAGDALVRAFIGVPQKPDWLSDSESARRWFRALKELGGAFQYRQMFHELDENGNKASTVHTGGIDNIVEVAANLCLTLHRSLPLCSESNNVEGQTRVTNINFNNSQVGFLNSGQIQNVESIAVNVSQLQDSGSNNIAEAIKQLTQAVTASQELQDTDKTIVLEQLEELSKQAVLAPEQRAKSGVLKAIAMGIPTTLAAAGSCAEAWSRWGPVILDFFTR